MNTRDRIKQAIDKYNDSFNGQVNLGSAHARADLAELIYLAVMKQTTDTSTHNEQQLYLFTNKEQSEHK